MNHSNSSSLSSSPASERQKLDLWQPEPLVPGIELENFEHLLKPRIVTSKPDLFIQVDGKKCLNFVTPNYLGLAGDNRLEQASRRGVARYGVGSCGPRAFYGTMDVHLELEHALSKFLKVEEAILYSFGFSTIASAIPAYAKTNDLVFADECCNFAIQQGLIVSRARVILFRHNNMSHLKQLIDEVGLEVLKKTRSFIIVEGLYERTGTLCPLEELIDIKKEYKIRLFVDESHSFGVLGSEGKGITQYYNLDITDVDLIMASIENALCAYGGFCAGSSYVVDHQRLAGTGYIFSASLPPLQVLTAHESLKIVSERPEIVTSSQELFKTAHRLLHDLKHLRLISNKVSPIKHLVLRKHPENKFKFHDNVNDELKQLRFCNELNGSLSPLKEALLSYKKEFELLKKFCDSILMKEQIAMSAAMYIVDEELTFPLPSIKIVIPGCASLQELGRLPPLLDSIQLESP